MFSITFTVSSMQELESQVKALMGITPAEEPKRGPGRPPKAAPAPIPIEHQIQALPDPPAPSVPAKPAIVDPFGDEAPSPVSSPKATFDDMKAALQGLAVKRASDPDDNAGLKRVSDMLSRFGCKKVKDVKPENYADVIARCDSAKVK